MKIESYKSFESISFDMSDHEVIDALGEPLNSRKNSASELEYHYEKFIVRFDADSLGVRECTLLPDFDYEILINGESIGEERTFLSSLIEKDGAPYECLGYLIFFNLGIAVTGFHDDDESQKAITVFRKGDWDQFKERMKPYHCQY